ncbi:MAG: dihydroorotase [Gammaproteobacteria bacterium]|nr:MAG: dihydroorotase [Gammaproteobacteria bacterium]PIE37443.1 MAG: dihydroorotase [Gammaproteobacteria bacterium]
MQRLTLRRPDDFHLHLRDGDVLEAVIGATARDFARAIIMPNLVPPVVDGAMAASYRERILAAHDKALTHGGRTPGGHGADETEAAFEPLMTLYLTDRTRPEAVIEAHAAGIIHAVKLYPAGATTNSDSGVTDIDKVMPVFEAMAEAGVILCIHGEVTHHDVDIFDREQVFIERVLHPLRERVPGLRVVLEHVTTSHGADYVREAGGEIAGTLTPHHLMLNRNHLLVGGVRPHYYCLPIVKRERHREALVAAATSGNPRFFLGTDSAPHRQGDKESACGCAGVFNAGMTLPCLATVFEEAGVLDRLEAFVSEHGARFYGLPLNEGQVTLERSDAPLPLPEPVVVGAGDERIVPFDPAQPIHWRVV